MCAISLNLWIIFFSSYWANDKTPAISLYTRPNRIRLKRMTGKKGKERKTIYAKMKHFPVNYPQHNLIVVTRLKCTKWRMRWKNIWFECFHSCRVGNHWAHLYNKWKWKMIRNKHNKWFTQDSKLVKALIQAELINHLFFNCYSESL